MPLTFHGSAVHSAAFHPFPILRIIRSGTDTVLLFPILVLKNSLEVSPRKAATQLCTGSVGFHFPIVSGAAWIFQSLVEPSNGSGSYSTSWTMWIPRLNIDLLFHLLSEFRNVIENQRWEGSINLGSFVHAEDGREKFLYLFHNLNIFVFGGVHGLKENRQLKRKAVDSADSHWSFPWLKCLDLRLDQGMGPWRQPQDLLQWKLQQWWTGWGLEYLSLAASWGFDGRGSRHTDRL